MGIMNIGAQALQANLIALQTAGNNIANVNTAGYSRQSAILKTAVGQFTGAGYIGKGVTVETIQRNFSSFLNRQSTMAGSIESSDTTRADRLKQLEGIFQGGASGLGASISDMMNSMSDVASTPTDLTARTVALTRLDEASSRMREASQRIEDLQSGVTQELSQKVDAVNTLAKSIADVNDLLSKNQGNGQSPNDLLDRRDQLIRELNKYVQSTSITAKDGTVGIFLGGSQALVLGSTVSTLTVGSDDFNDPNRSKLGIMGGTGSAIPIDETTLGGGEISGLLQFQNVDLTEGRNLLGRIALGVSTALNDQHKLGLDLDGNIGGDLLSPANLKLNILVPRAPAIENTGTNKLELQIDDVSKFVASDYEMSFGNATSGTIKRMSDGVTTTFNFATSTPANEFVLDGLRIVNDNALGDATPGDRYMITPYSTAAVSVHSQFTSPRALAVASPVVGLMGNTNKGSLQQLQTKALFNPPSAGFAQSLPVTLTFTGPNTYTRSDDPGGALNIDNPGGEYIYTSNQAIAGFASPPDIPKPEWSTILQGSPQAGDTFTIANIKDPALKIDLRLNSGNAIALSDLRDKAMFDGAAMTDGYAGLISQVGIRTQSANYAATVSSSIAANIEKDRTGVSGVNLDEEASKLLQYQQAYQASAKMLSIAQSIFQNLLQELGR
jgi:flagellar hook-associated protein 1 FlgK